MGVIAGEILNLEEGEQEEDEEDQEASKKRERGREGEPQKRAFAHFKSPCVSSLLGSICLTGLTIACLGQPIMPFKHFHFGGSFCPSS